MHEVIYPKVYGQYVLTKEGNLYDLDGCGKPLLIDKDIKDFISEWGTIVYLTKSGDVKVKNNELLENHFAGFFDGAALGSKENQRGTYYVCDSKGQWYGFGDNFEGRIEEETRKVLYQFEKKRYTIRYSSVNHDYTGKYSNFTRNLPVDEIKETSAYKKYAKMYGEKNLDIYFSFDCNADFITQLEQGQVTGREGPNVSREIECEVSIFLKNAYIFDPVPVDSEDLVPSKSDYGRDSNYPKLIMNKEITMEYTYTPLLSRERKRVEFYLADDQRLYLVSYGDRVLGIKRTLLMEDVVSIFREDKNLYIITLNDIQQYNIDKLAKGKRNAEKYLL